MVSHEELLEYILSAIPQRLRGKIPYEEAVELISDRWAYAAHRADPDNSAVSFLMLYKSTEPNAPHLFAERTRDMILSAVRRRLGSYQQYNNDLIRGALSFYEKGVPVSSIYKFLDPEIKQKVEKSYRIVTLMGLNFSDDISHGELCNVMSQKTTVQHQLSHDPSPPFKINLHSPYEFGVG